MIIVHLSKREANEHSEAHVRLVVHEPNKRNPLDYSLTTPGSQVHHVAEEGIGFREWLLRNYAFQRNDPQPHFRLAEAHLNEVADLTAGSSYSVKASIPQVTKQPMLHVVDLGIYKSVVEGIELAQQVVGFHTEDCYAKLVDPNRHESVVYMLSTCKGLLEPALILHLHEQLTALGFTTLYTPPESES
jgi:hypothetical protein